MIGVDRDDVDVEKHMGDEHTVHKGDCQVHRDDAQQTAYDEFRVACEDLENMKWVHMQEPRQARAQGLGIDGFRGAQVDETHFGVKFGVS